MERVYKNEGVADLGKSMKQIITVVIDPGHGGKDCGAIGVGGVYEKDIVLAISRKLQRMVNSTPGFRAILTRSGDYFIPLRKRLKIARKNSADMFISIHADAYKKTEARGFSIFVLSQRGATSEAARWLAEKENISELDQDLVDKTRLLKSVLLDLSQTATVNTSLDIGAEIIRSVSKIATLHSPRVEQAGFVVLKSPHIPSMLVEIGFLSNGVEAKLLAKDFYQNSIAEEIAAGIRSYFAGHRAN
jgi:N-acetylmuramoyl-L-alanine amidase